MTATILALILGLPVVLAALPPRTLVVPGQPAAAQPRGEANNGGDTLTGPSRPGPFRKLFTIPAPAGAQLRLEATGPRPDAPGRKVVCGMVVIQVDPSIDPRFIIRPKANAGEAKIRRIAPTTCAE